MLASTQPGEVRGLTLGGWRQTAPNSVALNVPTPRDVFRSGVANLRAPSGGSANGIPRHIKGSEVLSSDALITSEKLLIGKKGCSDQGCVT